MSCEFIPHVTIFALRIDLWSAELDEWRHCSAKEGQFLFQPLLGEIVCVPDFKNLYTRPGEKKQQL